MMKGKTKNNFLFLVFVCIQVSVFADINVLNKHALRTSQLTTVDHDENSESISHEVHRSLQSKDDTIPLYRHFGECETNCQFDYNCQYEFFCAAEHKAELKHYGVDLHRAYCSEQNVLHKTDQTCFSPDKLTVGKITECKGDCIIDSDCLYGLLCTKAHQKELKRWNYSPKYAYCKRRKNINHVCYDPTKTVSNV